MNKESVKIIPMEDASNLLRGKSLPLHGKRESYVAATKTSKIPGQIGIYRIDLWHSAGDVFIVEEDVQNEGLKFYFSHNAALMAGRKQVWEQNHKLDKEARKVAAIERELQEMLGTSKPEDLE